MKLRNLALSVALSAFSVLSYAQNLTEGVVLEGDSLPIGVAIGDSRETLIGAVGKYSEFDLQDSNRSSCTEGRDTFCDFVAVDENGAELGFIRAFFKNAGTSEEAISSLRWTFPNWTTSTGLSLADLANINDESELLALYPDARAVVRNSSRRSIVFLRSSSDGLTMVHSSSSRPSRFNGAYGLLSAPR